MFMVQLPDNRPGIPHIRLILFWRTLQSGHWNKHSKQIQTKTIKEENNYKRNRCIYMNISYKGQFYQLLQLCNIQANQNDQTGEDGHYIGVSQPLDESLRRY